MDEFQGLNRAHDATESDWMKLENEPPCADLVVLDDTALGFRDRPELWPQVLGREGSARWVLAKQASPVANGPLWQQLMSHHAEHLIAVVPVNDLRRTDVQISRELS